MTFTAVVTAHNQDPRRILGNLRYQTRKPDEVILLFSGDCGDMVRLREDFPELRVIATEDRQDWGHDKRAMGLEEAEGGAVGWFNADDSYDIRYVEKMMERLEDGADAAYCEWSGVRRCSFARGSSTSGNFVVRTGVGRRAGYVDRVYDADGTFIEAIAANSRRIDRVDDLLYFHNIQ